MNKKIIIVGVILLVIFGVTWRLAKKTEITEKIGDREPLKVTTQSVAESRAFVRSVEYPALVASDQQATLSAATTGTITSLNFELGSSVAQGQSLATIDEIGNNSQMGDNQLLSANVQALELAVESAQKNYQSAKDKYEEEKTYANKKAKEIAKISWESAKISLNGTLDKHLLTAPISGLVIQKAVSLGDSVNSGQTIAVIAKTALTKVQFYVDKNDLANFRIGSSLTINEDGKSFAGVISRISPVADLTTHRFLVEARPVGKSSLTVGTLVSVSFSSKLIPNEKENLVLPLSAITIGQNENYIFIAKDNRAQKIAVDVKKVTGEYAEIKTDLQDVDKIIISGSKLVQSGDEIKLD